MSPTRPRARLAAGIPLLVLLLLSAFADLAAAAPAAAGAAPAAAPSGVVVNGQRLSREARYVLQLDLGRVLPPGRYLLDRSGCWLSLTTGAAGCRGEAEPRPGLADGAPGRAGELAGGRQRADRS